MPARTGEPEKPGAPGSTRLGPASGESSAARPRPGGFTPRDFPREPDLDCDIVMKGGITSGVVYPLAVCELATTYRIRSVGGASAGAIAAAVAAAAELGRRTVVPDPKRSPDAGPPHGPAAGPAVTPTSATAGADGSVPDAPVPGSGDKLPAGYLGLSRFPTLLGEAQPDGRSLLFHLFRPQPAARRLFALVTGAIELTSRQPKQASLGDTVGLVWSLAVGLFRATWLRSLVGALSGLLLVVLAATSLGNLPAGAGGWLVAALLVALVIGLVVVLLGLLGGALSGILADLRALPRIGFGISSGRGQSDDELALTPWLYRRLQDLAGRPYEQPLTFADLTAEGLTLQMMTTNLSRSQPMVMPWDGAEYFFDERHFTDLFGPTVVTAMVAATPPPPAGDRARHRHQVLLACAARQHLRPFPRAADLPVIVATRMSLSFPVLIAAVPLQAVDWTRPAHLDFWRRVDAYTDAHPGATSDDVAAALTLQFDVNWFSDGGLTSNLPVQFFDSALPSRPTFAIDLAPFADDRGRDPANECANVYLPPVHQGVLHRRTSRWDRKPPLSQLAAFGISLVQTARTWVDESSLVMPGYRDRVVTVYQDADEGGLNLSMPKPVVDRLSERGRCAASILVDRFSREGGGWTNHRWLRFRTGTAALSDWLSAFQRGYGANPGFYDSLLSDPRLQPTSKITGARLRAAHERTDGLRAEIADWQQEPADAFTHDRPQQPPVLRLVPPTDPGVES